MRSIVQANSFKKDIKKCKKRGYNFDDLKTVITTLSNEEELEPRYRPHLLTNNWAGYWECHIKPDWLT